MVSRFFFILTSPVFLSPDAKSAPPPFSHQLPLNSPEHLCLPGGPHVFGPLPMSPVCSLNLPQPKRDGKLVIFKASPSFKRVKWRLMEVRWWHILAGWVKGQQISEKPSVPRPGSHTRRLLEEEIPASFWGSRWPSSAVWSCPTHWHRGPTQLPTPVTTSDKLSPTLWVECLRTRAVGEHKHLLSGGVVLVPL